MTGMRHGKAAYCSVVDGWYFESPEQARKVFGGVLAFADGGDTDEIDGLGPVHAYTHKIDLSSIGMFEIQDSHGAVIRSKANPSIQTIEALPEPSIG